MTEADATDENQSWPTHCETCGTELQRGTVDMDKTNADHQVFRPGEMAAMDFCPNPDCPDRKPEQL